MRKQWKWVGSNQLISEKVEWNNGLTIKADFDKTAHDYMAHELITMNITNFLLTEREGRTGEY